MEPKSQDQALSNPVNNAEETAGQSTSTVAQKQANPIMISDDVETLRDRVDHLELKGGEALFRQFREKTS